MLPSLSALLLSVSLAPGAASTAASTLKEAAPGRPEDGVAALATGQGGKGVLVPAIGAALVGGGWYLLEVGKQRSEEEAQRAATASSQLPSGALEREQQRLPPLHQQLSMSRVF